MKEPSGASRRVATEDLYAASTVLALQLRCVRACFASAHPVPLLSNHCAKEDGTPCSHKFHWLWSSSLDTLIGGASHATRTSTPPESTSSSAHPPMMKSNESCQTRSTWSDSVGRSYRESCADDFIVGVRSLHDSCSAWSLVPSLCATSNLGFR